MFNLITLDFETDPIEQRPHYPPKPVGFSLRLPEWGQSKYYCWGHYTGNNNCSLTDGKRVLREAYKRVGPKTHLLMHHSKFDLDVAEVHMGAPMPPPDFIEDTMFLLFLDDPHQRELGLKPSATRLLNMKPEEKDAIVEWVLRWKKHLETDFPEIVTRYGGIKPSNAGKYVAYVQGDVAAPYAEGDTDRALKIFELLYPQIVERGMLDAYNREKRVQPIFLQNERDGLKVDRTGLEQWLPKLEAAQQKADAWLRKELKAPTLDLDKDAQTAAAFVSSSALKKISYTETGRVSISKQVLKPDHFKNPKVASAFYYRQRCATYLETFIRPWLLLSEKDGRLHTTWNQVRQVKGNDTGGTRTGRPSSNDPNFLNMPRKLDDDLGKLLSVIAGHLNVPELPRIRGFILPDEKGHLIGRRDYNQQELRVLAHFEDGALLQGYLGNPRLDVHDFLRQQIFALLGLEVSRTITKNMNFGYIYGQGLGSLAEKMGRTVDEVKRFRQAQMSVLPGLKELSDSIKQRVRLDQPIRTWGGREYYVEPPMLIKGRHVDFGYKLLNYLIQGSSADITKESIIRYNEVKKEGRFMLTVYDENDISVPKKALKSEMLLLREAMMSIELDVPLMSDGEFGPNLGYLEDLSEPAPDLSRWGI